MKNLIRGTVLSLCFAIACMAYGAVPPLNVTVSDASGKVAFSGLISLGAGLVALGAGRRQGAGAPREVSVATVSS